MKRTARSQSANSERQGPAPRAATRRPIPVPWAHHATDSVLAEPFLQDAILAYMPIVQTPLARRDDALHYIWAVQALIDRTPSKRYARENQAFWCEKLLAFFDFSLERRRSLASLQFYDENSIHVRYDPTWLAHKTARTKRLRYRYRQRDRDDENDVIEELPPDDGFLAEPFRLWKNLYLYHRPSQYGFLTDIQSGKKALDAFPASINAFELFEDLAVLVSELRVHALTLDPRTNQPAVADPEIYPCLLRRMPKKVTPRGSDLLDLRAMVSTPWRGLSPEAHGALMASRFGRDVDESEMVLTAETEAQWDDFFGRWGGRERAQLEEIVQKHFTDWRHVRVHNDDGPQFYVGKRRGTHRWIGFLSCAI